MKKALIKDFQQRIVSAGKGDLVIINYEMLMAELDEALELHDMADKVNFDATMNRATKLLNELSMNLDFQYDISRDLMSLYIFISKQLIEATFHHTKEPIEVAQKLLATLLVGWQEANSQVTQDSPVIENSQQLYAGLTYGKGTLNETVYNDKSRGFKA